MDSVCVSWPDNKCGVSLEQGGKTASIGCSMCCHEKKERLGRN